MKQQTSSVWERSRLQAGQFSVRTTKLLYEVEHCLPEICRRRCSKTDLLPNNHTSYRMLLQLVLIHNTFFYRLLWRKKKLVEHVLLISRSKWLFLLLLLLVLFVQHRWYNSFSLNISTWCLISIVNKEWYDQICKFVAFCYLFYFFTFVQCSNFFRAVLVLTLLWPVQKWPWLWNWA